MPKPLVQTGPARLPARPFPWFCPKCRRKEVRRTIMPYQCPRLYQGRPITVVLPEVAVPRCAHCGELVFDYQAEEQVNQAYQAQIGVVKNGSEKNKKGGEKGRNS